MDPSGVREAYNKAMRRRRWWFIGLALALLTGLIAFGLLPPPLPYAFLKGSTLSDMGIVQGLRGGDVYYVRYALRRPLADVALSAELELSERSGWEHGSAMGQSGANQSLYLAKGDRDVYIQHKMTLNRAKKRMDIDPTASSVVVSRPCGPFDRVRSFLFELSHPKAAFPGGAKP